MTDKNKYVKENAINLQGKEYLQVAHRVVMFRRDHQDWGLITEVKTVGDEQYVYASVYNENGNPMATAHKKIDVTRRGPAGKYPLESAETGAIGRALGLCGYGTLAGDLDEGEELADAPVKKEWR